MANEKRLISAEQAYEVARLHHNDFAQSIADLTSLREVLEDCDTVDAVEVVRKPVKGYEGYYEVDQFGRVFGLERIIKVNDNGRNYEKPIAGKQLKQSIKHGKKTDRREKATSERGHEGMPILRCAVFSKVRAHKILQRYVQPKSKCRQKQACVLQEETTGGWCE